ncbi:MAG: heavy-metal-associated domain-containing protein [Sphingomonadaceae bacterium]|nr:heavy-metal-associated domain-containing protein [Sphingomonadaceae bacterium]
MTKSGGKWFRVTAFGLPLALIGGGIVVAQIEGPKRGIAPIASTGDFEVTGVSVNVTGKNAFEARQKGWEEAQRLAWAALWRKTHGSAGSTLSDSTLDGIVSAIVVQEEQIGPRRYVAKLGVLFDRARAGQLLGVSGVQRRSAPLLLLPITQSAGAPTLFEQRTSWQRSWAKYRTADSTIDYVRPSGAGGESLLLNAGQIDRRSRIWWRTILDQFGAADVIIPIARIERQWPGGPVIGRFSARYGPDNKFLGSFTLRTGSSAGIPAMMDQAVVRMDQLFQTALAAGRLRADASLVLEEDIVEQEELETEQEETPVEGAADPQLDPPDTPSLDDVVRSIVPENGQPNPPPTPPVQPPRQ